MGEGPAPRRDERRPGAFGGTGYRAAPPGETAAALRSAVSAGTPTLTDYVIDPSDGTESGNIGHLKPQGPHG